MRFYIQFHLHFAIKGKKPDYDNNNTVLYKHMYHNNLIIYRITVVMKVETDIIASIAASLIGRAVILVIIYVTV